MCFPYWLTDLVVKVAISSHRWVCKPNTILLLSLQRWNQWDDHNQTTHNTVKWKLTVADKYLPPHHLLKGLKNGNKPHGIYISKSFPVRRERSVGTDLGRGERRSANQAKTTKCAWKRCDSSLRCSLAGFVKSGGLHKLCRTMGFGAQFFHLCFPPDTRNCSRVTWLTPTQRKKALAHILQASFRCSERPAKEWRARKPTILLPPSDGPSCPEKLFSAPGSKCGVKALKNLLMFCQTSTNSANQQHGRALVNKYEKQTQPY